VSSAGRTNATRYTAAELARLCGVAPVLILAWSLRGLLPRTTGRAIYGFRDLVRGRQLARLNEAGWTPGRLGKVVQQALRLCGDVDAALAGLLVDDTVGAAVRLPDGRLCATDGQGLFDFDGPAAGVAPVVDLRSPMGWFQCGVEAEAEGRLADAIAAYERAVPDAGAEAAFNLGNCRYRLREPELARQAFEQAVAVAPDYAEAWNNLGTACLLLQDRPAAIAAFRRALAIVPHYADAHYNLADALAVGGDLEGAREHWRAYLGFDPNSRWAEGVRRRLQAADGDAC
jgi:tetratricopeptide (TPR) repeat protein